MISFSRWYILVVLATMSWTIYIFSASTMVPWVIHMSLYRELGYGKRGLDYVRIGFNHVAMRVDEKRLDSRHIVGKEKKEG